MWHIWSSAHNKTVTAPFIIPLGVDLIGVFYLMLWGQIKHHPARATITCRGDCLSAAIPWTQGTSQWLLWWGKKNHLEYEDGNLRPPAFCADRFQILHSYHNLDEWEPSQKSISEHFVFYEKNIKQPKLLPPAVDALLKTIVKISWS